MAVETVGVVEPAGEGGPVGLDCDCLTEGVVREAALRPTFEVMVTLQAEPESVVGPEVAGRSSAVSKEIRRVPCALHGHLPG
jgi:hypothetical protein